MSYHVSLDCPCCGRPVMVPRHNEGTTICINAETGEEGVTEASMGVTYNYCKHFNFRELNGQQAAQTIPLLEEAVAELGTVRHLDYWEGTPGNVGHTCAVLLLWAHAHPDAVWYVH